jgi:hypothetical protein
MPDTFTKKERNMRKYNMLILSLLGCFALVSCYKDFVNKAQPITGTWQLRRIAFKYSQESPSSVYFTNIFPPDSNRLTLSAGRYYEAKTTPSYDFMYFVRFGTTFRGAREVRQGIWEYYEEVYSPENDLHSGKLVFDRGVPFYQNQAEIFLDYDFREDSLRLFSNTSAYAGISSIYRFLGAQEARKKPENTIIYGQHIGSKWAFAEGFASAADSLRRVNRNSSYIDNLRDYFSYFREGAYLSDFEEDYPTFTLFLQGLNAGYTEIRRQQGYKFAVSLNPNQKPNYEIEYLFSK